MQQSLATVQKSVEENSDAGAAISVVRAKSHQIPSRERDASVVGNHVHKDSVYCVFRFRAKFTAFVMRAHIHHEFTHPTETLKLSRSGCKARVVAPRDVASHREVPLVSQELMKSDYDTANTCSSVQPIGCPQSPVRFRRPSQTIEELLVITHPEHMFHCTPGCTLKATVICNPAQVQEK